MLIDHPSPNFGARPAGVSPQLVVLHYTGMQSGGAALDRLCDPAAQVSAHYCIDEDGSSYHLVADDKRAWHAGVSHWRGCDNVNDVSIGVELVNPGHEFGYRDFPKAQIDTLLALLARLRDAHGFKARDFVGHSDVAPGRKLDPGELFPWACLAAHGFGIWPDDISAFSDMSPAVLTAEQSTALADQLVAIGYKPVRPDFRAQEARDVIFAFQQHWRQSAVTGVLDKGTVAAIGAVAALS